MILVDSHCHLDFSEFDDDRTDVLQRAQSNQVLYALVVSVDPQYFSQISDLVRKHPGLFASAGVHPNTPAQLDSSGEMNWLQTYAAQEHVIAIGETGLDYFRSEGDLEWQRERFRRHIRMGRSLSKPLIVHTRSAPSDTISIMREEDARLCGGVMHCFTEDVSVAREALDLGFYISISGIVTFKNADTVRQVAKFVPADRLLIETDSPYLAPVPYRGKRNEPGYVSLTATAISELRGTSLVELAAQTTDNFFCLFNKASRNGAWEESTRNDG